MVGGSWVGLCPAGMMLIGQARGCDDEGWPSKVSVFMLFSAIIEPKEGISGSS